MIAFIVPYRDREQQKIFYEKQMTTEVMKNHTYEEDYIILFIHQQDKRLFNCGALKNIGYLVLKDLYPETYKNITMVFNDVDIMPFTAEFLDYKTSIGTIKHFYGYTHTLGGLVSIMPEDFEKINGFPNFWTWGYEDTILQNRAQTKNLRIDRSQFYPLFDKNILMLMHSFERVMSHSENRKITSGSNEGIKEIQNLNYTIDTSTNMVNVTSFTTATEPPKETFIQDSRKEFYIQGPPVKLRFTKPKK